MIRTVTNSADVIDSRDVIARVRYLQQERHGLAAAKENARQTEDFDPLDWEMDEDDAAELTALEALAEEGENATSEWHHGATLIHEAYFQDYAQQVAEDIGAISSDAQWPLSYIDWAAATYALKMDYTSIDFDGETYWVRT